MTTSAPNDTPAPAAALPNEVEDEDEVEVEVEFDVEDDEVQPTLAAADQAPAAGDAFAPDHWAVDPPEAAGDTCELLKAVRRFSKRPVRRTTKRAPHAYRVSAPPQRSTKKAQTDAMQLYCLQTKNAHPVRYVVSARSEREALRQPPVGGTKVKPLHCARDVKRARESGLQTTRVVNEFDLELTDDAKTALDMWERHGCEIVAVPDGVHLLM